MKMAKLSFLLLFVFLLLPAFAAEKSLFKDNILRWGADAEGGAPYVFQDPKNPGVIIGFEMDLANALARELGVKAEMVQTGWDNIFPALNRGDFDIALNGFEITEERKQGGALFSIPYYIYTEQIVVRAGEKRINSFKDLKGMKVGTLGGAVSQTMLEQLGGVNIKVYTGQAEPYEDLTLKRLDAVFMDLPIGAYYARGPQYRYITETVGEGFYGIGFRTKDLELKKAVDVAIVKIYKSGELKTIYEKWGLWNKDQEKLEKEMGGLLISEGEQAFDDGKKTSILTFIPLLLKSAGVTVGISVSAMALAIIFGLIITLLRLYGKAPFRIMAYWYVEIYRGTPLLIQLYILYYGLPNIGISLSPLTAAILGLALNYAAYESELYRAGIGAIAKGQMEAALSLGMGRTQSFKRIILPQALKVALPGITNDFIALFKDSSLVSVIAMVELTKRYSMLASSSLKYFDQFRLFKFNLLSGSFSS